MDLVHASDPIRSRWAVLWTALTASGAIVAAEFTTASEGTASPYRTAAVLIIMALAAFELVGEKRTEVVLIGAAIIIAVLSLVELTTGIVESFFDAGTTLAVLIMVGVLFAATRTKRGPAPILLFAIGTTTYTLVSVSLQDLPVPHVIGRTVLGVAGPILAMWVTVRIIDRLAASAAGYAESLGIQKALARCSHLLLTTREEEGMQMALSALLEATAADFAYIDVNQTEEDGRTTWHIKHHARGANIPEGRDGFWSGNYDGMPWVAVELGAGRAVQIRAEDLPESLRSRYEAERIRTELAAPIMIEGKWIGTIGFTDFWRDGPWTDLEIEALTTAAGMVAGAWERERAREGLEELAEAKDRFIATVSHELRTPLAAVVGFAAALRDAADSFSPQEISEMAGVIAAQSEEVTFLVDDLLTAERAASGNLAVWAVSTNLEDELESVIGLSPERPTVRVTESVMVMADGLRTRQIIRNLLTNAARYGGADITVEIDVHDGMGRLTVLDNGEGVLGMDEDRIFDPYYRSPTDVARPESVGLGLAVARQLARLMAGDLVYRRQDGWTRFELSLPVEAVSPAKPSLESELSLLAGENGERDSDVAPVAA
jgi:signal transduction histidine kinase